MALVQETDSTIGDRFGQKPISNNIANVKLDISCRVTHDISAVEADWRSLEKNGVESPGQSFDFIKQWIDSFGIPATDQRFCVVSLDGAPIALFALQSQSKFGAKILAPFPGKHVGCTPPLVDVERMARLSEGQRAALWRAAVAHLDGVDVIYLPYVPHTVSGFDGIYDQLGASAPADTLFRSTFESWEQCDSEQGSRSRRKHDKQQSARLNGLGDVGFEQLDAGSKTAKKVLERLFFQRARRFAVQGIRDPFADEKQREFYSKAFECQGTLKGVLHVLRVNGDDVAVRYNLVHRNRMFCLITSISDNPEIQTGSPGKQCLLRVMKTIFDDGMRTFDMGAGISDEKRRWCNEQIPLRHYYVPLTLKGRIFSATDRWLKIIRYRVKRDDRLMKLFKTARGYVHLLRPHGKKAS